MLAGAALQSRSGPDVAANEDVDLSVPGLGGDLVDGDAGERGSGGVPSVQGVSGDPFGGEPGGLGTFVNDVADRGVADGLDAADAVGAAHVGEQWSGLGSGWQHSSDGRQASSTVHL